MNALEIIFTLLFLLSLIAQLVSMRLLKSWRETEKPAKLKNLPGLSVVTSLKGITPQTEGGLRCILKSEYDGELELVIAVSDADDPVIDIARAIVASEPSKVQVTWVTDFRWQEAREGARALNPRSAKMAEGIARASHDWIYWHAVDSWIEKDHLSEAMSQTGGDPQKYVTSFPVIIHPAELGSVLEAAALNIEVARFFLMSMMRKNACVAYGGSLLASRKLLAKGAGVAATLNRLTDDAILSREFAKAGAQCALTPRACYVPQAEESVKDFFKRQVRWLMIARYEMPSVFFSGLPFMLAPLGGICALIAAGAGLRYGPIVEGTVAYLVLRALEGIWFQRELETPKADYLKGAALALYDLILPIAWSIALFKSQLDWAGDQLVVGKGGELRSQSAPKASVA